MEFNRKTPRAEITIAKHKFQVPQPFTEGMTVTAGMAAVLNQTLAENARNNFASKVEKAVAAANPQPDPKTGKTAEAVPLDLAGLQSALDTYLKEYEFGVSRGGPKVSDPVEQEARAIAKTKIVAALKKQGKAIKDVETDSMNKMIAEALTKYPQIREEAQRIVAQRQQTVAGLQIEI